MRLSYKLLLLLVLLVATYSTSVTFEHYSESSRRAVAELGRGRELLLVLERLQELKGQMLDSFSRDYTYWDEMAKFVSTRDPQWAKENLESPLESFGVERVWVYTTNLALAYSFNAETEAAEPEFPLARAELARVLHGTNFAHFFHPLPEGLAEVRTAPIQRSADSKREEPPVGFLMAARILDEAYLENLALLPGTRASLQPPSPGGPSGPRKDEQTGVLTVRTRLPGWAGVPVAELQFESPPPMNPEMESLVAGEETLLLVFASVLVLVPTFFIYRWISRPLLLITKSLNRGEAAWLGPVAAQKDEIGQLARSVQESFAHRAMLEREVAERGKAEQAARASQQRLQEAMEDRARLGRDLHDGIIQSIYAIGLKMEDCRHRLKQEPEVVLECMDATRESLNAVIREVRGYILQLEPEPREVGNFGTALAQLADSFGREWAGRIVLNVDAAAAQKLTPEAMRDLLLIVREALTNAVRHSRAHKVEVSVQSRLDILQVEVRDDGIGGADQTTASGGRGLGNLLARAGELGAEITVTSLPGQGTSVALSLDLNDK